MIAAELPLIITALFIYAAIGLAYVLRRLGQYQSYLAPLNCAIAIIISAQAMSSSTLFGSTLFFVVYLFAGACVVLPLLRLLRRTFGSPEAWFLCVLLGAISAISAGHIRPSFTEAFAILASLSGVACAVYWFNSLPRAATQVR